VSADHSSMYSQVHENIAKFLGPKQRAVHMQAHSALWKAGLEYEISESKLHEKECEQKQAAALTEAEQLNDEDMALMQVVMQLASDAVSRLTESQFKAVADLVEPLCLGLQSPGPLVSLAEEAICTLLITSLEKTQSAHHRQTYVSPVPTMPSWHLAYCNIMAEFGASNLQEKIAVLDVIDMDEILRAKLSDITDRFVNVVSQDEFDVDSMSPISHWATVILLWLRKANQCCCAAGSSLVSTQAVRALKKQQVKTLNYLRKLERLCKQKSGRRDQTVSLATVHDILSEQAQNMANLQMRSRSCSFNAWKENGHKEASAWPSNHLPTKPLNELNQAAAMIMSSVESQPMGSIGSCFELCIPG